MLPQPHSLKESACGIERERERKRGKKRKRKKRKMAGRAPPSTHRRPEKLLPPANLPPRSVHVDREKTCPLLLRVFTKIGGHHSRENFAVRGKEPKNEFQIYTWKDATLRELTDLVKEVTPEARRREARLSFAFVYPDKDGCFVVKPVGKTFAYGNRKVDDDKALAELGFQTGDYLDVAIF